jgi:prephenate dehydrogenase
MDDDPGFFRSLRVAILGLGLMGGSLAMALKGKCAELSGVDPDPAVIQRALDNHLMDTVSTSAASLLPEADLIILAAPVNTILRLLQDLPDLHPGSAIVIDLGSTKVKILEMMATLPERFDPIGGHPMCGKEVSGLANADPRIYQGAPFAFTCLPRTTGRARRAAAGIAEAAGSVPLWIDASTHDRWVASTSHLPYLVSTALASVTPLEAAPLVGPGYRSTTRLAASSPEMMLDILMTNREPIQAALQQLRKQLDQMDQCLQNQDFEQLQQLFTRSAEHQARLLDLADTRNSSL